MEKIFMVKINYNSSKGELLASSSHGAFKSFRSASLWLIEEGYDAFYDDQKEVVRFYLIDKENNEEHSVFIQSYYVFD